MDHDIDWVALIGSWILAIALLQVLSPLLAVPLTLAAVFAWHRGWKRRQGLTDG